MSAPAAAASGSSRIARSNSSIRRQLQKSSKNAPGAPASSVRIASSLGSARLRSTPAASSSHLIGVEQAAQHDRAVAAKALDRVGADLGGGLRQSR